MPDAGEYCVLCVDDNHDGRQSLALMLGLSGYQTREAATGAAALQAVAGADVVILDVRLPDLDGFEVCRRIKADPRTANVPVILLSGVFTQTGHKTEGLDCGADAYLTKPVELPELLSQIRALLRARRLERERADAAVRRFAGLAQHIPLGLLIYQLDSADPPVLRVQSANRAATDLLGLDLAAVTGRPVTEVFPTISAERLRRVTAVAAGGPTDDLGELQSADPRAAGRWWSVFAFPMPDRSVGVAFQDVTTRRTAEEEVRRLNAELEDRVRERTADLAHKNAETEMFVYSVSHDLRSPLVNLQGFSKELAKAGQALAAVLADAGVPADVRDRGRAILDGKVAPALGFIQAGVLRLSTIIDALLRLSRLGRVVYQWEAVDVAAVVKQVVDAAHATAEARGAVVRVGDLPTAWGDRAAVEQLFANLVGNALTYLDPARPGVVDVGALAAEADGYRTYFVRDNGLGIPEAHRGKIFQAFQRAHPGVGAGEGLGLAIVARVAERHRGRVWVESRPGAGSTFFVALPATADAKRTDADPPR